MLSFYRITFTKEKYFTKKLTKRYNFAQENDKTLRICVE